MCRDRGISSPSGQCIRSDVHGDGCRHGGSTASCSQHYSPECSTRTKTSCQSGHPLLSGPSCSTRDLCPCVGLGMGKVDGRKNPSARCSCPTAFVFACDVLVTACSGYTGTRNGTKLRAHEMDSHSLSLSTHFRGCTHSEQNRHPYAGDVVEFGGGGNIRSRYTRYGTNFLWTQRLKHDCSTSNLRILQ